MSRQVCDAQLSPFLKQASAFGGSPNTFAPRVPAVSGDFDQAAARQPGHDPAHGRRLDLLRGGQFPQGFGTTENQHRQRRQASRPFAGCDVLLAQTTQQVNGSGMQPIGNGEDISLGFRFGLASDLNFYNLSVGPVFGMWKRLGPLHSVSRSPEFFA